MLPNKKYICITIDKEVLKQFKILMANLEIVNQSLIIENMMKKCIEKNKIIE
jgi:hypothetical protein